MKRKTGLIVGCAVLLNLYVCTVLGAQSHFAVPGASVIDPFKHSAIFTENFSSGDPNTSARLQGWLLFGPRGNWHGHLKQSIYHLSNNNGPNEANFFLTNFNDQGQSGRIAEVSVKTDLRQSTGHSGAGLIYSSSYTGDTLHAFILQRNGRYAFLRKDPSGFRALQTGECNVVQDYVFNSLAIKERSPSAVELFINNSPVATINEPGVGFQGGRIGLIGVSTGYFSFGTLTVAVSSDTFGRPGFLSRPALPTPPTILPPAGAKQPWPQGQSGRQAVGKQPRSEPSQAASQIAITAADVSMAKRIIQDNTMTVPGMAIGSSIKMGPGDFSAADALVIYMIKFNQQNNVCPPISVVAAALQKVHDTNYAKKAVAVFWKDYSTASGHASLSESFDWYINTKATEKHKISNMQLQGYVGAGEAWRRAMQSQRSSWEKSTQRQDEYILKRGAYRAVLNAEAAVAAAERAIH